MTHKTTFATAFAWLLAAGIHDRTGTTGPPELTPRQVRHTARRACLSPIPACLFPMPMAPLPPMPPDARKCGLAAASVGSVLPCRTLLQVPVQR